MSELTLCNGTLVDHRGARLCDCRIRGGKIAAIGSGIDRTAGPSVWDLSGYFIAPGLVDLHVHGGAGADFVTSCEDAVDGILAFHAAAGVTGLVATMVPAALFRLREAVHVATQAWGRGVAGVYLEGPFVSPLQKGAFNERFIVLPSVRLLREVVQEGQIPPYLMTLAPEQTGALPLLREAVDQGIRVAIGHTAASVQQVRSALDHGAILFTHLFNAMSGFHHREPGAVGAALDSDAYVELICDGVHVHPAAVRLAARAKGHERVCLVTDAMAATGLGDGRYELGGLPVWVHDGVARLADGTLAGSTLMLDQAVRNYILYTGCSLSEAIGCATWNPARVLGIDGHKGALDEGKDADLVVFGEDLTVYCTIRGGRVVYQRDRWEVRRDLPLGCPVEDGRTSS